MAGFPTNGDDDIVGTEGVDIINAMDGNDTVDGAGGDDQITGGAGFDLIYGGAGNDYLTGGLGGDLVYGGDGDDILIESGKIDDFDVLDGGAGSDRLTVTSGYANMYGGDDDDLLRMEGDAYGYADGGSGNDTLIGGSHDDELRGGEGYDDLTGGQGFDVFSGSLSELQGDRILDYAYGEEIRVHNASLTAEQVQLVNDGGFSYLAIDSDGDGVFDTRIFFATEVTGVIQLGGDPDYNTIIKIVEDGGYGTPTEEADYLVGTSGSDIIDALGGNDDVAGRGGDDQLFGGAGDDHIDGNEGNDVIEGGDGFDQLFGGDGDDTLTDNGADWGHSLLYGGNGADLLEVSIGSAELWGEDGDDTLRVSADAQAWLYGGWGYDTLIGGAADDLLNGGGEADVLTGGTGKDTFEGIAYELDGDVITDYAYGEAIRLQATITGSPASVVLEQAGADSLLKIDENGDGTVDATITLVGVAAGAVLLSPELYSNDTLIRIVDPNGSGTPTEDADLLVGTASDDVIDAGYGDDEVLGMGGADTLYGGGGDDQISGGEGNDHLDGGQGQDTVLGDAGDDVITDTGIDGVYSNLYGGAGADTISVHSGHGWLYGEDGDDILSFVGVSQGYADGGAGNDILIGGDRADRLVGGEGVDILTGGGARDYFEDYIWNWNGDIVTDFEFGESFYFFTWIDNPQTVQLLQSGADTLLKLDFDGNGVFETTITLEGVSGGRVQLYNSYVFIHDGSTANTAPTGADRTVSVVEDGVKTLKLSDFGYSDADGHSLSSISIVTAPQGAIYVGGVALTAGQSISAADLFAGNVTYRPAPNDNGPAGDSFTFQVVDSGSGANTDLTPNKLTFSIAAVNDAPTASGSATLAAAAEDSAPGGASVTSLFSGNYSDAADQVAGGSTAHAFAGVAVVGHVANSAQGVWQYSANGGASWTALPTNLSDGSALLLSGATLLRFLPAPDFNGTPPSLTVRLVDGSLGAINSPTTVNLGAVGGTGRYSAGTVTLNTSVTPVNDAPTAPAAKAFSLLEDGQASVVIGASDKDADTLSYSLEVGPAHGTVTFTANGYIYTPHANYSGEDTFVVRISDGSAFVLQSATATITPVNDAPTAPATRAITTAEDTSTGHVLVGAADPEGGPVSFSLKNGAGPQHGSVAFTDAGFVYTPGANYNGADAFTIVITDGQLTTEQVVSVNVTPVNDAPTLTQPVPDQDARQGTPLSLNLAGAFADVDGGALTITATQASGAALPSWLKVVNGVLTGTPTGTEDLISVRVTARDTSGATVTDTFDIYVGRVFNGTDKADRYTGGRGDDFVYGGKGNDELNGAAGDDWLDGGIGDDKFTGGLGADIFAVGYREGSDRINDMQVGIDHILLEDGVTALGWSTVKGNTVITLSGGGSITLVGITNLTQSGFDALFV